MTVDKVKLVMEKIIQHFSCGVYTVSKFEIYDELTLKVWYTTNHEDFKLLTDDSYDVILSYLNMSLGRYLKNWSGQTFTIKSKFGS